MTQPKALIIGGLDPSGGAGVLADLQAFHHQNISAAVVLTAVTAQNDKAFFSLNPVSATVLEDQLLAVETTGPFSVIKIGMLGTAENVRIVAGFLETIKAPVVLDPVFRSTTDGELLSEEGIAVLQDTLLKKATLLTPNLSEASILVACPVLSLDLMKKAAFIIWQTMGRDDPQRKRGVLIKGGHLPAKPIDVYYEGNDYLEFKHERFSKKVRGTGCRLASSTAAALASGASLAESIQKGQESFFEILS